MELIAGALHRREEVTETAQSNERCKKREPANENERGGLRPLPLLFPTASWSSYHPSDLDSSSYDEGSSKTFNSTIYSHSDNSCYDELSESEPTGASSRISTILSLVRGGDHQDVVHAPDGRSPQRAKRRRFAKSFRPWKPWRFSGSRRSRTPERAHALLCLALSDPALSTAALLASEQTQKGPNAACDKEEREKESDLLSLSTLLVLACIILFVAFVVGFGVGCALVRTRPVRGKAVLAVLPLWTRIPNNRWEKENRSGLLEVDSDPSTPLKERFVTTGSTLRKHSPAANIPLLTLMVDDTAQSESEPLAVLKGLFGGTESGVSVLEYIPAPRAGRKPEELCFTSRSSVAEDDFLSTSDPTDNPDPSSEPQIHRDAAAGTHVDNGIEEVKVAASQDAAGPDLSPMEGAAPASQLASRTIGPMFELLPLSKDTTYNSMLESGYPSAVDQTQHDVAPQWTEDTATLLIEGSSLPLHGEAIVKDDNLLDMQMDRVTQKTREGSEASAEALFSPHAGVFPVLASDLRDLKANASSAVAAGTEEEGKLPAQSPHGFRDSTPATDGSTTGATKVGLESEYARGLIDESIGGIAREHRYGEIEHVGEAAGTRETTPSKRLQHAPSMSQSPPYVLAVSFHPMAEAQGSGFRAKELWVQIHHNVTSPRMFDELLQDCRLGRVYVQLSVSLAYYTLFFWNDVEHHTFLPLAIACETKFKLYNSLQSNGTTL